MLLLVRQRAHCAQLDIFKLLQVNLCAMDPTRAALVRRHLWVHQLELVMDVQIVKLVRIRARYLTSLVRALVVVWVHIKISLVRVRVFCVLLDHIKSLLVRHRALYVLPENMERQQGSPLNLLLAQERVHLARTQLQAPHHVISVPLIPTALPLVFLHQHAQRLVLQTPFRQLIVQLVPIVNAR